MSQDGVLDKQDGIKKIGYAAIGLPSRARRQAESRFDAWRNRMVDGGHDFLREAIKEGEKVVKSVTERTRRGLGQAEDTIRQGSATARETGRGLLAIATQPIVPIEAISGVGPAYARKLAAAGVTSTGALVARCDSDSAITRLSRQADIAEALLSAWVQSADLSRIKGVGPDHMELLNAGGVGNIEQLSDIDPEALHGQLAAVNDEHQLVAAVPGEALLRDWKAQATALAS